MDRIFKALGDPTRMRIVDLLKEGDLTAGEIAEHFEISKPSISNHLNILTQTGLVHVERQGKFMIYQLNMTAFQELFYWLSKLRGAQASEPSKKRRKGEEDHVVTE